MKYLDEFRDGKAARKLSAEIKSVVTKPWQIMEICGGQTHSILKYSIEELLPEEITLIHGPGCPVCVTPLELIDKAIAIAQREDIIFTSFGDMLRVPGSKHDLLSIKAKGGNVKMVYSPLDAVKIAENNPDKKVAFFAVGFETTAPANAMSVIEAKRRGIKNYSILCSHVLVPPAIEALLSSKNNNIQGFLAAGHVCAVMGYNEYFPIAEKYNVPIVVTGFEPIDILQGILITVKQLEDGKSEVQNQYSRVVTKEGNVAAQKLLEKVFERTDRKWRGIGNIPSSGFKLKEEYSDYDAEKIFKVENIETEESHLCIAGEVLQGIKKPIECSAFRKECTPERPLGAPMVSTEGACAAYFHFGRYRHPEPVLPSGRLVSES
ncbi:MAG TPA: hydrogenase formation protein HypD [Ignavibacteriaceae bacterium]|nr:hydrogenase formation protein HypD [Ignavibacteriaceae bacterium]